MDPSRRVFLGHMSTSLAALPLVKMARSKPASKPNLVFVFADQWRACDTGYAGNKQVKTPHLDRLARQSLNFINAVSGCPVCSPYRASLLTGQYPLTHGVFYNDKPLAPDIISIAKVYKKAGYQTGYIGKWHLNGHPKGHGSRAYRKKPIPGDRRQGFDFWRACECTHDYNKSLYFDENDQQHLWDGYDAAAQTRTACRYIQNQAKNPFILFLSWGPPHAPYHTAPEKHRRMYDDGDINLRPNVPPALSAKARKDIAGYYAHISALDDCMGDLLKALKKAGTEDNTILVFTSDHGDMLYSHGQTKKQKPWEESVRVPFLLRFPAVHGDRGRTIDMPINTPDLMPTLLGLCRIPVPDSVEGQNFAAVIEGTADADNRAALLTCPVPFHQWNYGRGGREYRGVRTRRYTYCRDLNGPWLLYDNQNDPFQLTNLVNQPDFTDLQKRLDGLLDGKLQAANDRFLPGDKYMQRWDYDWDGNDWAR